MAHIHEKIDFTATVYVVYRNKVLLRLHEKYGQWFGVGGHIELDEESNTAALREVKEEVGLEATLIPPVGWTRGPDHIQHTHRELIPPHFLNIHDINEVHKHHDLIFFAISESDAVTPESLTDTWAWLDAKEVETHPDLLPYVRFYAQKALEAAHHYHS